MKILHLLILCFSVNSFLFSKKRGPNSIFKKGKLKEKKYISIDPAGIYGFYSLGIASFILNNYNVKEYYFIGASSGAWTSLICCYKHDINYLISNMLEQNFFDNVTDLETVQKQMYEYMLNKYSTNDFNLYKLSICLSEVGLYGFRTKVISNFESLSCALDCCVLSSHIPYLTSNSFIKKYDNSVIFDGGLTPFPPKDIYNYYTISPYQFDNSNYKRALQAIIDKNISKKIISELYISGYTECIKHNQTLNFHFRPYNLPIYMNYLYNKYRAVYPPRIPLM
tara:strand:- start:2550 stop:3392 length:843 start_codon:yes stop_codon:yes gene_type:complete